MSGLALGQAMLEERRFAPLDNPVRRHETDGFVSETPAQKALDAQIHPIRERVSVLTEAQGLVHGDRNADYGSPLEDWTRTAGMVSAMLAHKLKTPLTAEDCALILCCVKLSRQQHIQKRDNLVDLAGYAECVQWMIDERRG